MAGKERRDGQVLRMSRTTILELEGTLQTERGVGRKEGLGHSRGIRVCLSFCKVQPPRGAVCGISLER